MTKRDNIDLSDPERPSILACTRLVLLPGLPDGSKQAVFASSRALRVRLTELPSAVPAVRIYSIWVELCDCDHARVINAIGCRDLDDAGEAAEIFIAEAKAPEQQPSTQLLATEASLATDAWPPFR